MSKARILGALSCELGGTAMRGLSLIAGRLRRNGFVHGRAGGCLRKDSGGSRGDRSGEGVPETIGGRQKTVCRPLSRGETPGDAKRFGRMQAPAGAMASPSLRPGGMRKPTKWSEYRENLPLRPLRPCPLRPGRAEAATSASAHSVHAAAIGATGCADLPQLSAEAFTRALGVPVSVR
jgi:hypothetical protein